MQKRYLMTPGPTSVPAEVLLAQAQPMIHHRAPGYSKVFMSVLDGSKYVFQTENDVLIFSSSGTGGMESAVVNLFSPGDKVVVVNTGNFGTRFVQICEIYGLTVTELAYEWGEKANPSDVAEALEKDKEIKGVFATHSETSTGIVNDIKTIGDIVKDTGAAFIVDTVSGLGALEFKTDDWHVDVAISGSQKALMAPPGIAFVAVSKKAWDMVEKSTLPKFYFSYKKSMAALQKATPQNPFTPPVSLILGLDEALKMIKEEGLENIVKRHNVLGKAARAGVKALGLEFFGACDETSNAVTAIKAPEGIDGKNIVKIMREQFGITIAGGQGRIAGKIFRLGHLGYYDKFDILVTLSGLEMTLRELGYSFDIGAGVSAAEKVFMENSF
ncbi:MAG TPA: alanine--glyoxylate aminotransferase family protein [Actinobacteria bacterium]|nr:alanine--glyoxylate aminotransferase family protein [Actinomycetota bacterium]